MIPRGVGRETKVQVEIYVEKRLIRIVYTGEYTGDELLSTYELEAAHRD